MIELLKAMCACEEGLAVVCPMCKIKEYVETADSKSTLYQDMKIQNKMMKDSHLLHLEALNNYYHLIHKHCPCFSDKNCESPWLNKVRTR